jgi:Helicase HerA, central domain
VTEPSLAPIFEIFNLLAIVGGGALVAGGAIAVAPRAVGLLRQRSYDRATERERRRWVLRLDPSDARDPDAGARFVAALHPGGTRGVSRWASGWPQLTLAVSWSGGRARWEIEAPRQLARAVETAIAAAFPGAEVEETEPRGDAARGLRLGVRGTGPAAGPAPSAGFGTLLTELLARLPSGAEAVWTLRLSPGPDGEATSAEDRIGWGEVALDSLLNRTPRRVASTASARAPESSCPRFLVSATLEASSAAAGALRAWLFDAVGTVCSLRRSGWRIEASVGGRSSPMRLDAAAVADLWGLSGASAERRAVDVVRSRRLPAPVAAPGPGLRPIAIDGGRPVLVPESLFARHVFVLGRTGAGKSTELVALAADDLRAGRGFTFIDPHGDAVARLLDAVPKDQAQRIHLLELAEKDLPRAFNPIELDGADPELVAAQFVDTMRDLYFSTLGTAHRQVQYLRNALMTLLTMRPADGRPWTLESLYSLFVDPAFRNEFTQGLKDPVLVAFWKHQWQQNARGGDPSADAVLSKLGAFLGYPSIRSIVSAPVSTIRPRQIMDSGDVLLVDLSGVGRDHMRLFGSLVIARYNVAALGRQRLPAAERTPHTLYVDEVQNFDTTSLRSTPAEGRKFGLQIHMATQYMKALGQELQSAIRANVATVMLLQPSPEDIRLLGDLMAPLTDRDLVNLPRFRMAIRTEIDGEASVMTADVLPEPERLGFGALVRRISDERDSWRAPS